MSAKDTKAGFVSFFLSTGVFAFVVEVGHLSGTEAEGAHARELAARTEPQSSVGNVPHNFVKN